MTKTNERNETVVPWHVQALLLNWSVLIASMAQIQISCLTLHLQPRNVRKLELN